ncbi:N-acetyl-1-D-myo-inositol-2-amino-2-deoxy-alpha-D-glucopyranoside deacetylase [Williamsia sterculiae]|uniref:N-acetyl-1-D-myo-inositol-2-amino-2-deoxy-alpha- D-glucopyranoside deacetylase n=1 Tax=Williamsia sterculiae TaxID=1344003 RepID=UPI0009714BBD
MRDAGSSRRLLVLHAHPDDESIMTGGTIARYLDAGVDVTVVTFTLGEEGEVIGDTWAQLVADGGADQLGGYRIGELASALDVLAGAGALRPRFLGGAGHWRDSGMAGSPAAEHPRALVNASPDEPVTALADIIAELRPQVVIGYDPAGTYGHPDHRQVYRISTEAVAAAADRWRVDKHYWSVTARTPLIDGIGAARSLPAGWRMPADGELPSYPDDEVSTAVDVSAVYDRKVEALRRHATQVTVAPSGTEYALSNNILQPILAEEHFILVEGERGETDATGRERDLFAGVTGARGR